MNSLEFETLIRWYLYGEILKFFLGMAILLLMVYLIHLLYDKLNDEE